MAIINLLYDAALELRRFFEQRGWPNCIIGGLSVARWGNVRATKDVDVSLLTGFGDEKPYITELLTFLTPRRTDARDFALTSRVVLGTASNGVPVDISLAGLPYEEAMIQRSSDYDFAPGITLRTVSADDLVILKAFADRPLDWIDLEGILVRQSSRLNWRELLSDLAPLCELKEAPEIVERLTRLRDTLARK